MKNFIILFLGVVLLLSCQKTKRGTVNDFIDAINSYDAKNIDKLVSKDFVYINDDTLNNTDFYSMLDSFKVHKVEAIILKIEETDSLVKTKEQIRSILDSLLGVKPIVTKEKTYRFIEDRLSNLGHDKLEREGYSRTEANKIVDGLNYL